MSPVAIRLSIMMFLQFFVWGAWYVTAPNFLSTIGFEPGDIANTYSVGPIAGIITPLFVGMIADRLFSAQHVLGILHIAGGGLMFLAMQNMDGATSPDMLNWIFFGYMLTYYPTLALTNTVAMKNMTNPDKEFPYIRVFGTIGWIAAGVLLSAIEADNTIVMFQITAIAAVVLGAFSLSLPNTPPNKETGVSIGQLLGVDALVLLKNKSYAIFMLASVLICIPLAFYYQIASRVVEKADIAMGVGATMSIGQASEVIFMVLMPLFFARLGVKKMLAVGMLAWVVRYLLFAFGAPADQRAMILIGIALHGICYDFFFVTGQIYTDQKAAEPIRAQAQGLLVMLTLGVGMLIGAQIAGKIEADASPKEMKPLQDQQTALQGQIDELDKGADKEKIEELQAQKKEIRIAELNLVDWKTIWGIPAIGAAGILLFFLVTFHEDDDSTPTEAVAVTQEMPEPELPQEATDGIAAEDSAAPDEEATS